MSGPISSLKGIAFPFRPGSISVPAMNATAGTVVDAVRSLLSTGLGEVPLAPYLGTNLYSYVFENVTPLARARVAQEVRRIIETGEPRMSVLSVDTTREGDDAGGWRIGLRIEYELNGDLGAIETVV